MSANPAQQGTGTKPQGDGPSKPGQPRSSQPSSEKKNDPVNPDRGHGDPDEQKRPMQEDDQDVEIDIGREENEGGTPPRGSDATR